MMYKAFKRIVFRRCDGVCENPFCDAPADQVHHFLKTSTYPEYKTDPDNGMGVCGVCHSEIERRIREEENVFDLLPIDRYYTMLRKAGFDGDSMRVRKRTVFNRSRRQDYC